MITIPLHQGLEEIKLDSSIILIDVRTTFEFKENHIPGALNIPLNKLGRWANKKLARQLKIYIYCQSGHRSLYAAQYLENIGFTNVKNIGGIKEILIDSPDN
jgi:phage shock protein E